MYRSTLALFTALLFLGLSPTKAQNHALNFDGINDRIIVPPVSQYDFEYGTIEAWVRPQGLVGNACIIGNRSFGGARWSFHMSTTSLGMYNGGAFRSVPFNSTAGVWYHVAFVCESYNTKIYVNGNYIGETEHGIRGYEYYMWEYEGITGQELVIGCVRENATPFEHFKGDMDDIRIWDHTRTETQINDYKNSNLVGDEPGLVALFNFNQGLAGGVNTGLTTLNESVSLNHGFMSNFSLSGLSSNWVARNATLPVSLGEFKAAKHNNGASLTWYTAMEQNSQSFIIERSSDGNNFIAIGTVRAAGNSNTKKSYGFVDAAPLKGNNYYRLKQVDADGKFAYSEIRLLQFTVASKLLWHAQGNNVIVQLPGGNNEQYAVMDMNGATAMQGRLENGKLVIANKPAGVYNVRVWTETGVSAVKVVIQ